MKNYLLIPALLLLFGCLNIVYAQRANSDRQLVKGRIVAAADTTKGIAFSHIYNLNSEKGAISDAEGRYRIMASAGDLLEFRMVGYVDTTLSLQQVKALKYQIPLKEKVYKLRQVQVMGNRVQRPFAPSEPSSDPYVGYRSVKPSGRSRQKDEIGLGSGANGGAAITGGITAIANQFNKKEKQREKIRILKEQDEKEKYYKALFDYWFDKEIVAELTGLSGGELNRFIKFCKPSLVFLEEATEYEIITAIQKYHRQFQNINQY